MIRDLQKWLFTSILQKAILVNFKSHKNVMESLCKIKNFTGLKEVMVFFLNIKNFKSRRKVMQPFLKSLRFLRKWWSPFLELITLKVARKWRRPLCRKGVMEFFLIFRSSKSRNKATKSFFSDYSFLNFHMMHKFPGTIFALSVPTDFFWRYIYFFDYTF